ncbi:MAG: DUF2147 domain-containing protein [Ottowia sp.]|nr:DUF2147 domain-containing protein [Ottowia sp.]
MRTILISAITCLLASSLSFAADLTTPIGKWKTIDDNTGKQKSVVEIYEENGELKGKILNTFPDNANQAPETICTQCSDKFHNQPIIGMTFLWGLKKEGNEYQGGHILDPKNGRIYKANITMEDGGKKLKVRGFIGFSFIGRSQVWLRDDS